LRSSKLTAKYDDGGAGALDEPDADGASALSEVDSDEADALSEVDADRADALDALDERDADTSDLVFLISFLSSTSSFSAFRFKVVTSSLDPISDWSLVSVVFSLFSNLVLLLDRSFRCNSDSLSCTRSASSVGVLLPLLLNFFTVATIGWTGAGVIVFSSSRVTTSRGGDGGGRDGKNLSSSSCDSLMSFMTCSGSQRLAASVASLRVLFEQIQFPVPEFFQFLQLIRQLFSPPLNSRPLTRRYSYR